jgi:hypothetical protein
LTAAVIDRFKRKVGMKTKGEEQKMKLVYFDDFKLGVLKGDTVVDRAGLANLNKTLSGVSA